MSNEERLAEAVRSVRAAHGSAVAAIEAAERKATVERIRAALLNSEKEYLWREEISDPDQWDEEEMRAAASVVAGVLDILDAEAAR